MSFIRSLPFFIIALVFVAFIVANRHGVEVNFSPLDYQVTVPLYLVLFAGIFIGFLFAGWVGVIKRLQGAVERHGLKKESGRLKEQVHSLEEELDKAIDTGSGENNETPDAIEQKEEEPKA